jgi:hypothetical protein
MEEEKKKGGCLLWFGILILIVILLGVFVVHKTFFAPRNAVKEFLNCLEKKDYQRASYYLSAEAKIDNSDLKRIAEKIPQGDWHFRTESIKINNLRARIEGRIVGEDMEIKTNFFLALKKGRWKITDLEILPRKQPEGVI